MVNISLASISPVAFLLYKVGDSVVVKLKKPKSNEFRSNIGRGVDSFLVFKNETKIGMIPLKVAETLKAIDLNSKKGRIV